MKAKKIILTICGFFMLAVGAVGIFIPILPTTPFVLVAAACFAGNKKTLNWLLKNPLFSDYINNYKNRKGLKKSTVLISLSFLWATLALSALLVKALWFYILASFIALAVTAHLIYMSVPKNDIKHKRVIKEKSEEV